MKKTTKFLLVLAAVVAMTIGAVSTVMAADYPSIAKWEGNDKEGWTAVDKDGKDIKNTWAVSESGLWYYFDNTGEMVVNEFISSSEGWYYVGKDGVMAEGWVKFTSEEGDGAIRDAVSNRKENLILSDDENERYGKEVWAFFQKGGLAVEDAWLEADSGLWYYMDELVMVADDYSFYVEDDKETYGFAKDGHMLVGWEKVIYNNVDTSKSPIDNSKNNEIGWVYYNTDGSMVDAGWEKLGDSWYYFVSVTAGSRFTAAGLNTGDTVALINTYAENLDGNEDFYFDGNGNMVKGAVTLGKISVGTEQFMTAADEAKSNYTAKTTDLKNTGYYFDKANGAQKVGEIEGRYYYGDPSVTKYTAYKILEGNEYTKDDTIINFNNKATDNAYVHGAMLKDVIAYYYKDKNNNYYCYFDANGNKVIDDVIDFHGLSIVISGGKIVTTNGASVRINGRKYNLSNINGILQVNGKAVAYGASTDKTESYNVTVKVNGVPSILETEIAEKLAGRYVIGENVTYTLLTKDAVKFSGAMVLVDGEAVTGNLFKKIDKKLEFAFPNLGENVEGDITIVLDTVKSSAVTYNKILVGYYGVGETVTITATAGKAFKSTTDVTSEQVGTFAYKKASGVTLVNQVTFTMPATDVVINATETDAYTVTLKDCVNIAALTQNMFFAGDTITLKSKDANNYPVITVEKVLYDNGNDTFIEANGFAMPDSNVVVTAKATVTPVVKKVAVVTGAAVTLGDVTVDEKKVDSLDEVTAGKEVVINFKATVNAETQELLVTVIADGKGMKNYTLDANDTTKGKLSFVMPATDVDVTIDVVAKQ